MRTTEDTVVIDGNHPLITEVATFSSIQRWEKRTMMMNRAGKYRGVSKLHYEIRERRARVIFVMGLGMQGLAWAPQRDMLQAECQTLIYDHPGIGQSLRLVVISIWKIMPMTGFASRTLE